MQKQKKSASNSDTATYAFGSDHDARTRAWAFVRGCDDAKIAAGFPSLTKPFTVQVGIRCDEDRTTADKLADGAEVISYEFAKKAG